VPPLTRSRCPRSISPWQSFPLEKQNFAAHSGFMACLTEYLTTVEFNALEEVADGLNRPVSQQEIRERLLQLGYIRELVEGLVITDAGQMRLALDDRLASPACGP
jgi:hypothetical protein